VVSATADRTTVTTKLREFSALGPEEVALGLDELRRNEIDADRLHSIGRIGSGEFVLAVRFPTIPMLALQDVERPWLGMGGLQFDLQWHGLPSAAAILQQRGNPDAEVARRLRLNDAQRARDRRDLEEQQAAQSVRSLDREDLEQRLGARDWTLAPTIAQAFYLQALAFQDLGHHELARETRAIAKHLGNRAYATPPAFPFPGREWRK
jgi:hypothetical protein